MHPALRTTAHRPWPLPGGPWVMAQTWRDLLFAHWPLPPAALAGRVPAGLELDTYEGEAWIGVVPFRMSGVRLRGTPGLPGLSAFPELNVRTYVRAGDRAGVLFFSLDAASALAVAAARRWFHLPYFRARMSCTAEGAAVRYASQRTHRGAPPAELRGRYAPTGPAARSRAGSLEHFLTERYCLYAVDPRGGIRRGEVHHEPWPLQPAELELELDTTCAAHEIALPDTPPLLHFARCLHTAIWAPTRLRAP